MTRFVVDAPTLVQLAEYRLPVHPHHQLLAPHAVRSQALDLLLARVRGGRCTDRDALLLHEAMTAIPIRLLGDRVSRRTAWQLARQLDLETVQEVEYLAVAVLQGDALVTSDPRLSALADGRVRVAAVADLSAGPDGTTLLR